MQAKKILSKFLFYLPFLFFLTIHAEESPEKITVELATDLYQHPFYIGAFQAKDTDLPQDHIRHLEKILWEDLHFSLKAKLLEPKDALEKILQKTRDEECFHAAVWNAENISFVVRPKIIKNSLHVDVFIVHSSIVHTIKDIPLTGNIQEDTAAAHEAADIILERIFGEKGIAGSHILFTKTIPQKGVPKEEWISEIWEIDYNGKYPKKIIGNNSYNLTPTYFPNKAGRSEKFLFVSYLFGQPKIFLSSLSDPKAALLIQLRGNQLLPSVSRQGDKIAFISDAAGRPDLFLQHFHPEKGPIGKPIQLFSYPRAVNASPTFSPDGNKIAFVSDKDWTPRIYLIELGNPPGNNDIVCLTMKNRENTVPSWSPDGKKIAYSAKTNGIRQIWIYDFETKQEIQITSGPGHKENPCFAPNSLHIVYNTTGEETDLYLVDIINKSPVKITSGPEINHYPAWEPKQK
ncbi:MAG: hypothetical protein Tsb0015_05440 [Simkaniaceae bacterium]